LLRGRGPVPGGGLEVEFDVELLLEQLRERVVLQVLSLSGILRGEDGDHVVRSGLRLRGARGERDGRDGQCRSGRCRSCESAGHRWLPFGEELTGWRGGVGAGQPFTEPSITPLLKCRAT